MKELKEVAELWLYSAIPMILIWITIMSITFIFVDKISYVLGVWIYAPISMCVGAFITYQILKKAGHYETKN